LGPRSYCPECGSTLRWFNLIPVVSFILQKGRCAYCGAKVSLRYPAVELLTTVVFWLVYRYYGFSWQAAGYWTLSALLTAASFIDLEYRIIPNEITYTGIILGFVFSLKTGLFSGLAGFALGGGIMLATAVFSKGNMGGGDIKLAAVMGLFLGWQLLLPALFWGFFLGAVCGVTLLALGIVKRKDPFPFGPFLAAGSIISLLWGNDMILWYAGRFI